MRSVTEATGARVGTPGARAGAPPALWPHPGQIASPASISAPHLSHDLIAAPHVRVGGQRRGPRPLPHPRTSPEPTRPPSGAAPPPPPPPAPSPLPVSYLRGLPPRHGG